MITDIRRYFKSSSQVILWVVFAAFVLGLLPTAFRQLPSSARWALRINNDVIDYPLFNMEVSKQRDRIAAFRAQYGEYADWLLASMGADNPQHVALRTLARQTVVSQFAKQLGIDVSSDYVAKRMNDSMFVQQELAGEIPGELFDAMGSINCTFLNQYLRRYGISVQAFEQHLEQVLAKKLVMSLVAASFYLPQFDSEQYMFAHHAKRNFSILSLSLAPLLAEQKKKSFTDAQLNKFYEEQNQRMRRYWVPEKRSGIVWTFDPKSYNIEISQNEIEDYYEKNKVKLFSDQPATVQIRRILCAVTSEENRAQMREKAQNIREQLRGDANKFSSLAKTMSDDTESAKNGGLLAAFARGSQEHAVDRAAFLLPEDGAISDVLETSKGYEIIQRVSKKQPTFKSLTSVRNDIRDTLTNKKFESLFVDDIKRVIELDSKSGNDAALLALVKAKGGRPEKLDNKVLDESPSIQKMFSLKGPGDADSYVENQKGIAVKLVSVEPASLPSLESIKKTVLSDLQVQQANDELAVLLQDAKKDLATMPLDAVKAKYHAETSKSGWLESEESGTSQDLKKKGLPVAEMLQLERKDAILTHVGSEKGYLVRLDEIEPITGTKSDKRSEVLQEFTEERMRQYQEGFIASLYRNAKIETNDSLITIQE